MLQQNNEVIRSLLTEWFASATSDQSAVLVLDTTYVSLQSLFQNLLRHGSSHAQGAGQPAQHY